MCILFSIFKFSGKKWFMGHMTYDLFREIVDQVENKVEFISLASRGEPLICNDIEKMLTYTRNKFLNLKKCQHICIN